MQFLLHFVPFSWNVLPVFTVVYHLLSCYRHVYYAHTFSHLGSSNKSGDTPSLKGSKVSQDSDPDLGSFHAVTGLSPFSLQSLLLDSSWLDLSLI